MLPFSYASRNLMRDPARFLQKVGGAAGVIFLVFAAGAFNHGMKTVLRATGSPENVILLGSGSEESVERSEISLQVEAQAITGIRGIDQRLGNPAVSGEVHYMGMLNFPDGRGAQALLRGVTPSALEVHREIRILEGRFPRPGEVMVGRLSHHLLEVEREALRPGQTLVFEGQTFRIVGVFDAIGTVMESEVWMNRTDLMTLIQRETLSCVVVRMSDPGGFKSVDLFTKQRLDLELTPIPETEYYQGLANFYGPLGAITWLTAAMVGIGAVFGGLNMLYAAFASRSAELATLQVLGYSRLAVLFSLIQESLIAVLLGTLVAALLAVWLLEGMNVNFSMGTFRMDLPMHVTLTALAVGLILGVVGALPPALTALRNPLPVSLRSL